MFLLEGCHRALDLDEHVGLVKANSEGNLDLLLLPRELSGGFVRPELHDAGTAVLGKPC